MIEDELRALLRSRAATSPDDPARVASVHSRITAIRRRRAAGGALALVLIALAGLFVIRLPGTNDSLPPGVPEPPYFEDSGLVRAVPGYVGDGGSLGFTGPDAVGAVTSGYFRYLLVVRCEQKGELTARSTTTGDQLVVPCRTRVGDHFEGAIALPADQARRVFAPTPEPRNLTLTPGSPGTWSFGMLKARAPERLADSGGSYLVTGRQAPRGGTVDLVPKKVRTDDPPPAGGWGFLLQADCVAGVRLSFRVPAGELGQITCDPTSFTMDAGFVTLSVSADDMRRLGLAYGRKVRLTVVRSGTETDQWRVSAVG